MYHRYNMAYYTKWRMVALVILMPEDNNNILTPTEYRVLCVVTIIVILSMFLFVFAWCAGEKDRVANTISLGMGVQTTSEYEQVFNDSFEGNVIKKDQQMYTIRDPNGTERTLDKCWLEKSS